MRFSASSLLILPALEFTQSPIIPPHRLFPEQGPDDNIKLIRIAFYEISDRPDGDFGRLVDGIAVGAGGD